MVHHLPRVEARTSQWLAKRAGGKLGVVLLLTAFLASAASADVNRIVLRVNDEIVTLWEFEQRRRTRIGDWYGRIHVHVSAFGRASEVGLIGCKKRIVALPQKTAVGTGSVF